MQQQQSKQIHMRHIQVKYTKLFHGEENGWKKYLHMCDCIAYNMIYNINNRPSVWPNNSLTIVFSICVCIFPFNFHFQFSLVNILHCSIFRIIRYFHWNSSSLLLSSIYAGLLTAFFIFLLSLLSDSKTKQFQINKKEYKRFLERKHCLPNMIFFVIIYYFHFDVFIYEWKYYFDIAQYTEKLHCVYSKSFFFIKIDSFVTHREAFIDDM